MTTKAPEVLEICCWFRSGLTVRLKAYNIAQLLANGFSRLVFEVNGFGAKVF